MGLKIKKKILIGHIHGLFGVKGWVKVFSYTRPRTQILDYPCWYLGDSGDRSVRLEQGKAHKDGVIAKLHGIENRDEAVQLLQDKIWIDESELPALVDNEFYWYQLIGLQVTDTSNQPLGEITRLFETGANDVMVVRDKDGVEHLVPYVMDRVIRKVDLANKLMVVDWDPRY